jgi:hypothetical protein
MKRMRLFTMAAVLVLLPGVLCGRDLPTNGYVEIMPGPEDYTQLWWAEGPPYIEQGKLPHGDQTLCFQSGRWGLAFDANRVRALRAGERAHSMNEEQGLAPENAALGDLPTVQWDCAVTIGNHRFACVGHAIEQDPFFQPVRFVESGRFFQRVVIEGLQFADSDGKEFPCRASLEISAWPDRLAMNLELEPKSPTTNGTITLRVGDHRQSASLLQKTFVRLELFERREPLPKLEADPALAVGFDEGLGCQTLQLPEKPWNNPDGTAYPASQLDALDRWKLVLRNDADVPTVARLMFTQRNPLSITGFTPMLCEPDGRPTGLPVQISKNWHHSAEKGDVSHQGPWFHGFAFVPLPAHAKRELLFQMVYARYGGVCAASLAQLSLIGWGHNQFWDEVAIGSFGESICFEPGRVQRRCFIDDIRPLMTLPQGRAAKPWGWADNCGGGDFLMWQDGQGRYQPMCATRTDYRAYGPCLTDAIYSEQSAGGELAARMEVSVPRSEDYLRTFIHLRYDVRRPMQWKRLAFFQLGADLYNDTPARRVAIGDVNGMREEWEPKRAKDVYDRRNVPMTGAQPWVSVHGVERADLRPGLADVSRGLIVRNWRAVLGGKVAPQPHASFFCTEAGEGNFRTSIELSPPPDIEELRPGDFVEADLELVVFPADAAAYYGPDKSFREALNRDADTWRLVQREVSGNDLDIQVESGTVLNPYPVILAVNDQQGVKAVIKGGLGYLPLTFTGLSRPQSYRLFVNGNPLDQSVHGNDFWQSDYNATTKSWRLTFNIPAAPERRQTIQLNYVP